VLQAIILFSRRTKRVANLDFYHFNDDQITPTTSLKPLSWDGCIPFDSCSVVMNLKTFELQFPVSQSTHLDGIFCNIFTPNSRSNQYVYLRGIVLVNFMKLPYTHIDLIGNVYPVKEETSLLCGEGSENTPSQALRWRQICENIHKKIAAKGDRNGSETYDKWVLESFGDPPHPRTVAERRPDQVTSQLETPYTVSHPYPPSSHSPLGTSSMSNPIQLVPTTDGSSKSSSPPASQSRSTSPPYQLDDTTIGAVVINLPPAASSTLPSTNATSLSTVNSSNPNTSNNLTTQPTPHKPSQEQNSNPFRRRTWMQKATSLVTGNGWR
jgi:hypothetical protein